MNLCQNDLPAQRHPGSNQLAENSHQPVERKERAMERARQMRILQKFASVHGLECHCFNQDVSRINRVSVKQSRIAAFIE
jgi:putative transposase